MSKQLSNCCKAPIDLNPKLDRPECYTCSKCGRVIGSPMNPSKQPTNPPENGNKVVDEYSVPLTLEELTLVTAVLMMHSSGIILDIHPDKKRMLKDIAMKFSIENIKNKFL